MKTLLIIDMQNDFMPWGTLPVPHGETIIPIIKDLIPKFSHILATLDSHPLNHVSFATNHGKKPGQEVDLHGLKQKLWPIHCVEGTMGADFIYQLPKEKVEKFFLKGTDFRKDSYSAFFDTQREKATGLADYLKENNLKELYVVGVATEYCVKYSVLDALKLGFPVFLIEDGCKGIDPEEEKKAVEEMNKKGASIIHSNYILSS